jgi:lincosamide nucleotidyltransferase B/F
MRQVELIETVRAVCAGDERVTAAVMYGSFAKGEADAYSDIEFYIFIQSRIRAQFQEEDWINHIAPTALVLTNEYGTTVAIFQDLIRGEFHFQPDSEIPVIGTWGQYGEPPYGENMVIADKTGEIAQQIERWRHSIVKLDSPQHMQQSAEWFINTILFAMNVLKRGERLRAMELLLITHRYLLGMARKVSGQTQHWLTPSRLAERDLPAELYTRFASCTADLSSGSLERAYINVWGWAKELIETLNNTCGVSLPPALIQSIDARMVEWFER